MNYIINNLNDGTISGREALDLYDAAYAFLYDTNIYSWSLMVNGEELVKQVATTQPDAWKRLLDARHGDPFTSDRELAAFFIAFSA